MRSSLNLGARAVQSAGARGRVAELRPLTPAGKSATARTHKLGATARSLAILEHVASSQAPVDVLDIISSLKLPKATAYRRVEWFITQGYLSREPGRRRLIVGPKLANLAFGALSTAKRIAADLASAGLVIASGMARGVDSAAHLGALDSSGQTIAVLGSGVDVVYPAEHAALACSIAASGAVVSELAPGTPPRRMFFPRRNRIISGLSRAVVVIEAGERSGSLITARLALEQGRSVLAVPGNVLTGRNRGAHGLLRAGAKIVESADDILEELAIGGEDFGEGRGRK